MTLAVWEHSYECSSIELINPNLKDEIKKKMEVLKISLNKIGKEDVKKLIGRLKQGTVIVYPTETSYGLGGDAWNKKAVERIYKIKGRDFRNPLPVIISSQKQLKETAKINSTAKHLIKKYWPGPLTLVLPAKNVPHCLLRGGSTIALRISSHPLAQILVKELEQPLISTSANVSGQGDCYSAKEVIKQFSKQKYKPDLILDAGLLPRVKPSTIVEIKKTGVKVLRQGAIKVKS